MKLLHNGFIGELLIELGVSPQAVEAALERQKGGDRRRTGEILSGQGGCDDATLARALAMQSGLPFVEEEQVSSFRVLDLFPEAYMEQRLVAPVAVAERSLRLIAADPYDVVTFGNLEAVGFSLDISVATPESVRNLIRRREPGSGSSLSAILEDIDRVPAGPGQEGGDEDVDHLRDIASEAPVIKLVNAAVSQAVEQRASDIHFEPFDEGMVVRLRIDGVLHPIQTLPRKVAPAVISRIKIMAKLNIAERRLPQDGRLNTTVMGREIDVRVSVIPTIYGESAALRLLDRASTPLSLEEVGMPAGLLGHFRALLTKSNGMILVTGPTGSGKTTTLYAALMEMNDKSRKIITVEDPVEYLLPGISQIQVKPQIGLTFASGLRSIVRQDPDIIMVGEIRDAETAKIGVQSALTGHLVFSTVHTNDAAGAVTRLLDMEVEDYLLTSSLLGVLAQRLARQVCRHCKVRMELPAELLSRLGGYAGDLSHEWRGEGCPKCFGTGYLGRIGLFELIVLDEALRQQILTEPSGPAIRKLAASRGMNTMMADGIAKVAAGITDLEEVLRVTIEEA